MRFTPLTIALTDNHLTRSRELQRSTAALQEIIPDTAEARPLHDMVIFSHNAAVDAGLILDRSANPADPASEYREHYANMLNAAIASYNAVAVHILRELDATTAQATH